MSTQTSDFTRRLLMEQLRSKRASARFDAEVQQLMEQDWHWQLQDNPEYASQAGQHQWDAKLQDLSPSSFNQREAHDKEMLAAAKALLSRAESSAASQLKLFVRDLESEITAFELGCHLYPVDSIG